MAMLNRSDIVGNYTVQNLIKSNAYTETYRVEDHDKNPYFLKLFIVNKMPQKLINLSTGIVREIEYCKQLNHRNIISYITHGEIEIENCHLQYCITNYFSGQVLSDKIATNGPLSEEVAIPIFNSILNGVDYIHSLTPALCHNDLDTSNIMLSEANNSEPIIIDLGHISERSCGMVHFDTSDLNPFYHAHETMARIFDEQGDIFSACAILYTMLTGEPPWQTDIPNEGDYKTRAYGLMQYRKQHDLEIESLNVSDMVKFILNKGLCKDRKNRFDSVREILNILNSHTYNTGENIVSKASKHADKSTHNTQNNSDYGDPNAVDFRIKRSGGAGFKDIAGMQELKDDLYRKVIFVIKSKEIAEQYKITPLNGILLYGPPGCGKTFFAEKFAEETGFNFLLVKASDVGSSLIHGTQTKINKLFKLAEQNTPIVLCFDEFDAFVPDRSSWGGEHQSGEVNEFLTNMNNCSKRGIFIIATSNRPDKIDPAILRSGRIDRNIYVPLPDLAARREMFSLYLSKRPLDENLNLDYLAELTEGYIASDIAYIVNDAAMTAAYSRKLISQELLLQSINNIKPTLVMKNIEEYDRMRAKLESGNRDNNIRTTIQGL